MRWSIEISENYILWLLLVHVNVICDKKVIEVYWTHNANTLRDEFRDHLGNRQ